MPTQTTPPVTTAELAAVTDVIANGRNVKADLSVLQKIITADKSAAVAALVHVAVLMVAAFGMHLSAGDVASLGSIVTFGLSYFVSVNHSKTR